MRLATWNINGIRARLDFMLLWLQEARPDVVGLQELKIEDEKFPFLELEAAGYKASIHGQKSWNGVAVLTKRPAQVVQVGLPGAAEAGARLITVETDGISFTTVYCPNGKRADHPDFPLKLDWFDALIAYVDDTLDPARPAILCGDFNLVPEPQGSWNETKLKGTIFHTEDERLRYQRLIDWGFVDAWRQLRPDDSGYTWWDYRAGAFHKKQGLRIDLMLATPTVAEQASHVEAQRDWRKKHDGLIASDHAPVVLDLA